VDPVSKSKNDFRNAILDEKENSDADYLAKLEEILTGLDLNSPVTSPTSHTEIRLGHVAEGQDIAHILKQFANAPEDIVFYDGAVIPELGTDLIWDPKNPHPDGFEFINDVYRIRTGMKIVLFKPDTTSRTTDNILDVIEVVLLGDVDGNGEVNYNDCSAIYNWLIDLPSTYEDPEELFKYSSYYQAGIIKENSDETVSYNDVSRIYGYMAGSDNIYNGFGGFTTDSTTDPTT
ncbi:MAG: hypothetical protein K2O05_04625, partial [Anaeroplasmataceae bacterium]|nr:hypothetical protein [Anaeroplasmataceae bacterium]